jgi:glutathione S-transferase
MPEHSTKLYYFPLRGRAETARLLLTYTGTKFEDVKIAMEQWPAFKEKTPMGQLPVLEVDGKQISQSVAIARYVAREHGLLGKSNWEMAKADMLVDGIFDMWVHMNSVYMPKLQGDMKTSEENWKKFVENQLTPFLERYSKFFNDNGTGYFVGNALTWADIAAAEFFSVLVDCFNPTALESHPQLKTFSGKILSLPQLKEYVSNRPSTPL